MMLPPDRPRRAALYVPGSNARALAKAAALTCDMLIVDLEDAVPDDAKAAARDAALAALAAGMAAGEAGLRINGPDSAHHADDLAAAARSAAAFVVVPKVEQADTVRAIGAACGRPVLAMIETPAGVLAAPSIATACAGLIAGTNDLAETLRLPPGGGRAGLALALQQIVLAARAAGGIALDGVWNRLDDPAGLDAECREGRACGFDGKTVIHPGHIAAATTIFGPTDHEIEDARALVAAATGGAERFRGRMIESMHLAAARRTLALAGDPATL